MFKRSTTLLAISVFFCGYVSTATAQEPPKAQQEQEQEQVQVKEITLSTNTIALILQYLNTRPRGEVNKLANLIEQESRQYIMKKNEEEKAKKAKKAKKESGEKKNE